jgi:Uma2 family endonuclease
MAIQIEQEHQLKRHLFSINDYERMIEAGILGKDDRVELIKGDIVEMAALGEPHEACVRRLSKLLERRVGDVAMVSIQNSISIPTNNSQPQPDAALLRLRDDFYSTQRPTPDDVLLLIEVAESSLRRDRNDKVPIYAEACIPEVWVVDLKHSVIEVYSDPTVGEYQHVRRAGRGEVLRLPVGTDVSIAVDEVLGYVKL